MIVGPCSIHSYITAMEFGAKLNVLAQKFSDDLVIVMRTYFEKPRTRLGWKGYINDPDLDGTFNMDKVSGFLTSRARRSHKHHAALLPAPYHHILSAPWMR